MIRGVNLKHERIASILAREIRSGRVGHGDQLPGEVELAKRFAVSRNTVRSALAVLTEDGLITTRTGKGSFVLFDGRPLDDRLGWTHALAEQGIETQVRVLRLAHRSRTRRWPIGSELESPDFDRDRTPPGDRRRRGDLDRAQPHPGARANSATYLPGGWTNGSITATLSQAGLHLDHGRATASRPATRRRGGRAAGSAGGTWFLYTRRTSWTADDRFAEQVDSLLDPQHFELSLNYSGATP